MRKLLAFFALLIPFYSIEAMARTGTVVEVEQSDDDDEDNDEDYEDVENVWIGPGIYYGFWFDDEDEYHRWYRHDYHHGHGDHHGRGGGGHHGGGGGHHGGGGGGRRH